MFTYNFFSVVIGLNDRDARAQFILKSQNVEFRYIENESVTPSQNMLDNQDKVIAVHLIKYFII